MKQYRKKPVVVEAEEIQQKPENWTGEHWCEVFEWDGKIS